jgi:hypothetical protein
MNSHHKHRNTSNRRSESTEFCKCEPSAIRCDHERGNSSKPERCHHERSNANRRAARSNRRERVQPTARQERRRKSERNSTPRRRQFHGSHMRTLRKRDEWRRHTRRRYFRAKRSQHCDETEERDRDARSDRGDALNTDQGARIVDSTPNQSAHRTHDGIRQQSPCVISDLPSDARLPIRADRDKRNTPAHAGTMRATKQTRRKHGARKRHNRERVRRRRV